MKQQLSKNKASIILIVLIASLTLGGCSNDTTKSETQQQPNPTTNSGSENTVNSDQLVQQFDALLQQTGNLPQAFDFIHKHINDLTTEDISQMLFTLENTQIKEFPILVDRYFKSNIQEEIASIDTGGNTIADLIDQSSNNPALNSFLTETRDSGYMVETVEGMFNPAINYSITQ